MGETPTNGANPCCKVGRTCRTYGLDAFATELEHRWTGAGSAGATVEGAAGEVVDGGGTSLRELARMLNRRVLHAALTDAGVAPVDGEAENLRRILESADVSERRRIEARRRLESDGVDVERLEDAFVSHQSIFNHLQNCRNVSRADEPSDEDRRERAKSTVFGLQNRTSLITEQTLDQLASHNIIESAEFDVYVDLQVVCERCGRSHEFERLLDSGGCSCET